MCYKAFDFHDRIVYFKEKLDADSGDCFIANDKYGRQGFYKIRHRLRGPAVLKGRERRWFADGVEVTYRVEQRLSSLTHPFEESGMDFKLKECVFRRFLLEGLFKP